MRIVWEQYDFPEDKVFASKINKPENGESLRVSIYRVKDGAVTHKTCPSCSAEAGRYVWKEIGSYHHRFMADGVVPQAWCADCRKQGNS